MVEGSELDFGEEWICQKHWSVVPAALRREHSRAKQAVKRNGDLASERISSDVWMRCKKIAAEIAFGLG